MLPRNVAGFTPMHRHYTLVQYCDILIHWCGAIFYNVDKLVHFHSSIYHCSKFLKWGTCIVWLIIHILHRYPKMMLPPAHTFTPVPHNNVPISHISHHVYSKTMHLPAHLEDVVAIFWHECYRGTFARSLDCLLCFNAKCSAYQACTLIALLRC